MDWFRIVALLLALYLLFNLVLWLVAPRLVFPAPEPSYTFAEPLYRRLELPGGAGQFVLTLQEPSPAEVIQRLPGAEERVVLYFHGNATDLGYVQRRIDALKAYGFTVCAPDYPGYGQSGGKASESGTLATAEASYQYLLDQGYEPQQIVIWGRSLGSGPACHLASQVPCDRLILETAFASIVRVKFPFRITFWDMFDNLARARDIQCPALVLHGKQDRIVPFDHAEKLAAALAGPVETLYADTAGHNDLPDVAGTLYWETVLNFAVGQPPQPLVVPVSAQFSTLED
ncbi:MAG: alpha/beta hydrolase [Verrucomicrobiota bacterium JB022]|nr:alpha/beta hydrolase [Verrucomicrobiota bacterium JB022]